MNPVVTAVRALLRSRDRATSILTVLAFALPHALLLAVTGGVLAFQSRASSGILETVTVRGGEGSMQEMAIFYLSLAIFAGTLLVVPIISMGAAAARLGMSRRARDLAILRLVGLAPGKTKLACVVETCVFALVGVAVGSVLYGVTLPAWSVLSFQGLPMRPSEMWVGVLVLLSEALFMIALCALSSWMSMRKVAITPLGVTRHERADKVSPIGVILGIVLLVVWMAASSYFMNFGYAIGMMIFMGFLAAIFLVVNLVGTWSVSVMGRIMAGLSRSPQMMVAGRRLMDDPRSVWRSFGSVALVGFLVGVLYPVFNSVAFSGSDEEMTRLILGDMNRGMLLTFGITLALGAISTAMNQAIRVLDSASQMQALDYMGSPASFLDRSRRLEVALPAFVLVVGAMVMGLMFMAPILSGGDPVRIVGVLAVSALVGVVIIVVASEMSAPLRRRILADSRAGKA